MFPEEIQSPVVLAASKQWEITQGNWSSEGTRRWGEGNRFGAVAKLRDGRDAWINRGSWKGNFHCESGQLKSKQLLSLFYQIKIFWFSGVLTGVSVCLGCHSVVETSRLEGAVSLPPEASGSLLSLLRPGRGAHSLLWQGEAGWEQSYFLWLGFRFFRFLKASSELLCGPVQCD